MHGRTRVASAVNETTVLNTSRKWGQEHYVCAVHCDMSAQLIIILFFQLKLPTDCLGHVLVNWYGLYHAQRGRCH
jgi:hypothetical protein